MIRYRTIVADPPWHYERFGISRIPKGAEHDGRAKRLPYPSMSVEEIAALPVAKLADPTGCHLYLWTTNRYLRDAFDVMASWGFRYGQTVVWAKKFKGGDAQWIIRAVENPIIIDELCDENVYVNTLVVITPVGIDRLEVHQEVKAHQPLHIGDLKVTTVIGTDTDRLVEAYLKGEIEAAQLP